MNVVQTELPGVKILEPRVFADSRGCLVELYREDRFPALGLNVRFVQDNLSRSVRGVVRGMHYQLRSPQAKLCRVIQGEVDDVVVDLRRGSPTFRCWVRVRLSGENHRQVFIPHGCAHGFLVLSATADFLYKCDDFYRPDDDCGFAWDDPEVGIEWACAAPVLSAKDAALPRLAQIPADRLPVYSP